MQATVTPTRSARWLAPAMLLFGGVCLALVWMLLALYLGRPCGWMAAAGALVAALMLRLASMPSGWKRALLASVATIAIIALVNWGIAAAQMGISMGLNPWDSSVKLGLNYAWNLSRLANQLSDLVWMGIAMVVAVVAAR